MVLVTSALPGVAMAATTEPEAESSRLQHAKELLGYHHMKTIVATPEGAIAVRKYVDDLVKSNLSKKWKKDASRISKAVIEESDKYGFDPLFLSAVIQTESGFSPTARGTSGEIGMMQLMPSTGTWIAHEFNLPWKGAQTLLDPVANIRLGAAYLSLLRERFGNDGRLYIPAYNMGPAALKEAVEQQVHPVDYAKRVMQKYLKYYSQINALTQRARAIAKTPEENS
jgi:soluble lytic murein transglycosylase-like protein